MLVSRPHHRLIATRPTHHHRQAQSIGLGTSHPSASREGGRGRGMGPPAHLQCERAVLAEPRPLVIQHRGRHTEARRQPCQPAPTHRQAGGVGEGAGPSWQHGIRALLVRRFYLTPQSRTAGCRGCDGHVGHRPVPQQVVAVAAHVRACRPCKQRVQKIGSSRWLSHDGSMAASSSSLMLEAVKWVVEEEECPGLRARAAVRDRA